MKLCNKSLSLRRELGDKWGIAMALESLGQFTPRRATKNYHFYAVKCGFTRVESDPIVGAPEGQFV